MSSAPPQRGQRLPELRWAATSVQMFRFAAVTWNAHRIHFDLDHARAEGYEGIVVQGSLHGAYLAKVARRWARPDGQVIAISWRNRHHAVVGQELTCGGTVVDVERDGEDLIVTLQLEERDKGGTLVAEGGARVLFPDQRTERA